MSGRLQPKPKERSWVRMIAAVNYFRFRRWLQWHRRGTAWAHERALREEMPYRAFTHRTPLRRELANVEMRLQENKIHNLRLAIRHLDGLCLHPGETLSSGGRRVDLQVRNETRQRFSLHLSLTGTHLVGEWRSDQPLLHRYQVYEAEHRIQPELWGGYTRHNTLRRRVYTPEGEQVDDQFVTENHAIMMYRPLLSQGPVTSPADSV